MWSAIHTSLYGLLFLLRALSLTDHQMSLWLTETAASKKLFFETVRLVDKIRGMFFFSFSLRFMWLPSAWKSSHAVLNKIQTDWVKREDNSDIIVKLYHNIWFLTLLSDVTFRCLRKPSIHTRWFALALVLWRVWRSSVRVTRGGKRNC